MACEFRSDGTLDRNRRRNTLADVNRDQQLAAIGRFVRRVLNWYRFFTPHYWRLRAHRNLVEREMQRMLPAPYDAYAVELQTRACESAGMSEPGSCDDKSWKPVLEKLSAKALDRRFAAIGSIEIAAWAIEDVHSAFASIDQDVIAAISRRTGEAITSFSDLGHSLAPATIAERIKAAFSSVNTHDLAHNPLVGSVGEAAVFRHLNEADVDTDLAPHLNTPRWDLTWNGYEVNVKTYADATNLSSHFDKHPGTAVVVPGDAIGIPEHGLHFDPATGDGLDGVHDALASGSYGVVIVDDALSGGAIHDHLQHAETLATHGETVLHGHLPLVTMALSGFREFDLLLTGKTDLATATRNVALDATGTGVGGAVGSKAGAILGTIICPGLGTALGGIAGAIFGAIKGRAFTGDIKQRPFKDAVAAYEAALAHFRLEASVHETEASSEFARSRAALELNLRTRALDAKQRVEQTKQAVDSWIVYESWLQPDEACDLIGQSSDELTRLCEAIQKRYEPTGWWRKVLWPDVATLAQQQALAFLLCIQKRLYELYRMARNGQAVNRGQLMTLLGAVGVLREEAAAGLGIIYAAQAVRNEQARSHFGKELTGILRERQEAEMQLKQTLECHRTKIQKAMLPALTNLNSRDKHLRLEGAKLGLSL